MVQLPTFRNSTAEFSVVLLTHPPLLPLLLSTVVLPFLSPPCSTPPLLSLLPACLPPAASVIRVQGSRAWCLHLSSFAVCPTWPPPFTSSVLITVHWPIAAVGESPPKTLLADLCCSFLCTYIKITKEVNVLCGFVALRNISHTNRCQHCVYFIENTRFSQPAYRTSRLYWTFEVFT